MSVSKKIRIKTNSIDKTISVYNRLARQYTETWFNDPVMEPMLEEFLSIVGKHAEILDAGCGTGRDIGAMAKRGVEAVGIDLSSSMVREAKSMVPSAIFRLMDIRQIHYPPETFSGIWACAVLVHFPLEDMLNAMKEFARVLHVGGILGLSIEEGKGEFVDHLGRYRQLYSWSDCYQVLDKTGFRVIKKQKTEKDIILSGQRRKRKWLQIFATKQLLLNPDNCHIVNGCPFCKGERFLLNRSLGLPGAVAILLGDSDLFLIPDIAPLIEGHLLLISAEHYDNFGALPRELEKKILSTLRNIDILFHKVYGKGAIIFEHGSSGQMTAGCCIDHAHWHCLPYIPGLTDEIRKSLGAGYDASIKTLRKLHQAKQPYIYIGDSTGYGTVFYVDVLPSQFLRKIVASISGHKIWRWQDSCEQLEVQNIYKRTFINLYPKMDQLLLEKECSKLLV